MRTKRQTIAHIKKRRDESRLAAMQRAAGEWPEVMIPVDRMFWPAQQDPSRVEVWRSLYFLAQVFDEGGVTRVSVNRMKHKNGQWVDNITWDELMEIKRQIGRADAYAVEVLPPDRDIVNVAPMRHFWILPERVVGWSRGAE